MKYLTKEYGDIMKEEYSFQERRKLLKYIFDLRSRRLLANCLKDSEEDRLVRYLDEAVQLLDSDGRNIIRNDFMSPSAANWWQSYYARTTYYRLKNSAMKELMAVLKR